MKYAVNLRSSRETENVAFFRGKALAATSVFIL